MLNRRLYFELGTLLQCQKQYKQIKSIKILSDDPLTIHIRFRINKLTYTFRMLFLRYYPFQPIVVFSEDKDMKTEHMYRDNSMCLRYGNDNWNEDLTIKDIVENLIELLTLNNPRGQPKGKADTGHVFSNTQLLMRNKGIFFFERNDVENFKKKVGRCTIIRKEFAEGEEGTPVSCFLNSIDGKNLHPIGKNKSDVLKLKYYRINKNKSEYAGNLVFFDKKLAGTIMVFNDGIKLYLTMKATEKEKEDYIKRHPEVDRDPTAPLIFVLPFISKNIDDEKEKRLKLDEEVLHKPIAIFGLGSIGSRVFLDLARAGFDNFLLVDDDIFLPNNIIRHELTSECYGELKVNALEELVIKKINSKASILTYPFALNGQQSTSQTAELLEKVSISDIIIDCTANSNLVFSLNEVIKQHDINYISGSIISGGLGNIILKREKGNPKSIIDVIESQKKFFYINQLDNFFTNDYSGKVGEVEYVASMSDCSIVAGLVGKYAINMLKEDKKEVLKHDIYVSSTSDQFLDGSFSCKPINANKRNYKKKRLNNKTVAEGQKYYEDNYPKKNK